MREPEVAWNCAHAVEAESRADRGTEIRDSHPPRHFKGPKRNSTKEDIIRPGCSLPLRNTEASLLCHRSHDHKPQSVLKPSKSYYPCVEHGK